MLMETFGAKKKLHGMGDTQDVVDAAATATIDTLLRAL